VLRSPSAGFRFLGVAAEKSVPLVVRRLFGPVCRRLEGLVEELLVESSSLSHVVRRDGGRRGDLPVRVKNHRWGRRTCAASSLNYEGCRSTM
jgi:hypothetical protein